MRKLTYLIVAIITLASPGFGLIPSLTSPALAQTSSSIGTGQALEIAPPVIYLSANPGQSIKTKIFLRNVSRTDLIVTGEANDFEAAGENGAPKVILNDDSSNPYSMKSWIRPPASLTLVPREVKTMLVTINVPSSASPGGHYGVIRFTGTPPSLQGTGVSLTASLGALILMTVNGPVTENLTIKEFSASHNGHSGKLFESAPVDFSIRLQNTGNVHEQPAGQIAITDMFGKKVANVNVNLPPRNILPQSIRKFEQTLDKSELGNKRLFGRYHADLKLTYGADKKVVTSSMTFWVIPYKLIGILIAVLIAGFFGLRYGLRRYNRYILSKAGSTPPAPRRTQKTRRGFRRRK